MNEHQSVSHPKSRSSTPSSGARGTSLLPPKYGVQCVDDATSLASPTGDPGQIRAAARHGIAGPGGPLPHLARVQSAFGRHDLSRVVAHTDTAALASAQSMSALAYTLGNHVAFARPPTLHTAAHEAAHVIQQRAGVHLQSGVGRVGDAYEQHADAVADRVVQGESAEDLLEHAPPGDGGVSDPPVQRLPDWMIDIAHNRRKVGAEITEDRGLGNANGLGNAVSTPAWNLLLGPAKTAAWTSPVANLPDRDGTATNWRVAPAAGMMPGNFTRGPREKRVWMVWGNVSLTEDYGDFEWIIRHPAAPQGVTWYRDRLAEVAAHRGELRAALPAVPGAYVMAMNDDPQANESLHIGLLDINGASIQITFESSTAATTKQVLLEGLTSGLNRNRFANRATLGVADDDVTNAVANAAGHITPVANVDMGLIAAYVMGDLCHKLATLITGPQWGAAVAANFKQWRTMFPKSHPTQITYQAITGVISGQTLADIATELNNAEANILTEALTLFADKLIAGTVRQEWGPRLHAGLGGGAHGVLVNAITRQPAGGTVAVAAALDVLANSVNANFMHTEYANAVAALTDPTLVARDVVRSTGFATHGGTNRGFAFEDRAEVATTFPNLTEAYDRLVAVVDRY